MHDFTKVLFALLLIQYVEDSTLSDAMVSLGIVNVGDVLEFQYPILEGGYSAEGIAYAYVGDDVNIRIVLSLESGGQTEDQMV